MERAETETDNDASRDYHPLWRGVPADLHVNYPSQAHPEATTPRFEGEDFKPELLPLRSPLLRESLLVSFPPLNNMLKFRG